MVIKDFVIHAVTALLVQLNPSAVDQYFSPNYTQHSTLAADGTQPVKDLVITDRLL